MFLQTTTVCFVFVLGNIYTFYIMFYHVQTNFSFVGGGVGGVTWHVFSWELKQIFSTKHPESLQMCLGRLNTNFPNPSQVFLVPKPN